MKAKGMNEFTAMVHRLTEEWNESAEPITCEFSTSAFDLAEKTKICEQARPNNGYWQMTVCQTCIDHNGRCFPIHCEIRPSEIVFPVNMLEEK